jgi:hypothetical protein
VVTSKELSYFWEANSPSAFHELHSLLWNKKLYGLFTFAGHSTSHSSTSVHSTHSHTQLFKYIFYYFPPVWVWVSPKAIPHSFLFLFSLSAWMTVFYYAWIIIPTKFATVIIDANVWPITNERNLFIKNAHSATYFHCVRPASGCVQIYKKYTVLCAILLRTKQLKIKTRRSLFYKIN